MTKQISQKKIKDYPVITLKVEDIKKDPTNPNNMTLEQINGLEKSIVNFGRLKYIVVDQDNILIDGEHRLEVEKANGTTQVQVIQVPVKNEIERKMMRETLNQLHGDYDKQKQSSELLAIFENQRLDELAELLGKPREEFENLITRYNPEISFVKEEDESKLPSIFDTESFVKRGEIWQLGRHKLMCGDSTNTSDIGELIDSKADLIIVDPPYGVNYGIDYNQKNWINENKTKHKLIEGDSTKGFDEFISKLISIFPHIMKPDAVLYFFHSHTQQLPILQSLKKYNLNVKALLIWVKNSANFTRLSLVGIIHYRQQHEPIYYCYLNSCNQKNLNWFGGYDKTTVLEVDKPLINLEHPTMKPTELLTQFIKNSTKENAMVCDVCLGSGSTLIACEQTNRICYGMEIDEHYCSVIIRRWEEYTNKKAVKLVDRKARKV